jgi:hypothetical protein
MAQFVENDASHTASSPAKAGDPVLRDAGFRMEMPRRTEYPARGYDGVLVARAAEPRAYSSGSVVNSSG